MQRTISVRWILFGVYGAVSLATFYHSMWGFATLAGNEPERFWFAGAAWWFFGALMAAAVDVGMAAIVYARATGKREAWLVAALIVAAGASAFTQLIYAAHHATAYTVGAVAPWLEWLQIVLDLRVIILPLLLPGFALVYAFAAHENEAQAAATETQAAATPEPAWVAELRDATADDGTVQQPGLERNEPATVTATPQPGEFAGATTEERRAIVPELIKTGLTQNEIAEMFGVSPSAISRDVKTLNGKIRR